MNNKTKITLYFLLFIFLIGLVDTIYLIHFTENNTLYEVELNGINPELTENLNKIYIIDTLPKKWLYIPYGPSSPVGIYYPFLKVIVLNKEYEDVNICHELMHHYHISLMTKEEKKYWTYLYKEAKDYFLQAEGEEWVKQQYFLKDRFEFYAEMNENDFERCFL